jgi:hypothetical protein
MIHYENGRFTTNLHLKSIFLRSIAVYTLDQREVKIVLFLSLLQGR